MVGRVEIRIHKISLLRREMSADLHHRPMVSEPGFEPGSSPTPLWGTSFTDWRGEPYPA